MKRHSWFIVRLGATLAFACALTCNWARANVISFSDNEASIMDGTSISSPITFDAANFGFNGILSAPPTGFFFTIGFSKVSGLFANPVQVYLTDGTLPTANLPFFNGCTSTPTPPQGAADCVHETGWTFGPADSSGPTGTLTSPAFFFTGATAQADAIKVEGWVNSSNIYVALAGGATDQIGTCGSTGTCSGQPPQMTLTILTTVASTPEPGTAGVLIIGIGALALLRRDLKKPSNG
jgi:hypothetical protein